LPHKNTRDEKVVDVFIGLITVKTGGRMRKATLGKPISNRAFFLAWIPSMQVVVFELYSTHSHDTHAHP
jgi:hypothetical protein